MQNKKHESPQGEVSGAFLLGMLGSFDKTNIIAIEDLPIPTDRLLPDAWYPYDYLINLFKYIEDKIPDSKGIMFWAGVKFIELWYWDGPGKEIIFNSLDWVYCNEKGAG